MQMALLPFREQRKKIRNNSPWIQMVRLGLNVNNIYVLLEWNKTNTENNKFDE